MKTKIYISIFFALYFLIVSGLKAQEIQETQPGTLPQKQIRQTLGGKTVKASLGKNGESLAPEGSSLKNESPISPVNTGHEVSQKHCRVADQQADYLSMQLQINILEKEGIQHVEAYNNNSKLITEMFIEFNPGAATLREAGSLVNLAAHHMKMGREMREEANAEQRPGARLGRMSNANEEELLALDEQKQAMILLNKNEVTGMHMR